MVTPNIFDYATSELSQDAFLCWLLSWANSRYADEDKVLHETSVNFLCDIFKKCRKTTTKESFQVKADKQYKRIDVFADISQGDKKYALVIEDKTDTSMHGDQLRRYKEIVEKNFPNHEKLYVYLKTGAISQRKKAEDAGYTVYTGRDLLDVLDRRASKISNNIFNDFHEYLKDKVGRYERFRENKVDDWAKPKVLRDGCEWHGFMEALQEKTKLCSSIEWGYTANQSGGELVAYWGGRDYKDSGQVYLEIHYKADHRSFLAFKVDSVPEEKDRGQIREYLCAKLKESAKKHGWDGKVNKPDRFGSGKTMIFCQTVNNDCWLAKDSEGKLDMDKTVENLKKAGKILDDAIKC